MHDEVAVLYSAAPPLVPQAAMADAGLQSGKEYDLACGMSGV
ncbi:MAG: hypothetical protein V2I51_18900 [Anderseniella sp.]|nr:hypothetical protein [Anderseniella sp.]